MPDIAKALRETLPSLGPDEPQSRDDDAWQTYSAVSFTSEGYLPGESPFDPPNSYPSGFGRTPPPQLTEQQKTAIDRAAPQRFTPITSPRGAGKG